MLALLFFSFKLSHSDGKYNIPDKMNTKFHRLKSSFILVIGKDTWTLRQHCTMVKQFYKIEEKYSFIIKYANALNAIMPK